MSGKGSKIFQSVLCSDSLKTLIPDRRIRSAAKSSWSSINTFPSWIKPLSSKWHNWYQLMEFGRTDRQTDRQTDKWRIFVLSSFFGSWRKKINSEKKPKWQKWDDGFLWEGDFFLAQKRKKCFIYLSVFYAIIFLFLSSSQVWHFGIKRMTFRQMERAKNDNWTGKERGK